MCKFYLFLFFSDDKVVWKRVVQGVREMCDVCETTLFNIHWACRKCGFVVCIDCYKDRKEGSVKVWCIDEDNKERDKFSWLLCNSKFPHEQDKLMLTQIVAADALSRLGHLVHEIRKKWSIPMYCDCKEASKLSESDSTSENCSESKNAQSMKEESNSNEASKFQPKSSKSINKDSDLSNSPLDFFAQVALSKDKRESEVRIQLPFLYFLF